jgi:hypothetical protein
VEAGEVVGYSTRVERENKRPPNQRGFGIVVGEEEARVEVTVEKKPT